ncbi:diacylglycerol/lipid kinase family protein [Bifidobacterium miconisargentati]|uniref:diacylglycerol/lipid kinase family protein n=1 Tax=Bifidobacterium miconisargentati TaxID=2834437 RepID=UPI001BDD2DBD|nr:diacylglycerol kinase family protein [Bifidobacterium miconisargentati]MBW3089930.1 diacylglycerol kinase [Bifidobacterium miconisargentati]
MSERNERCRVVAMVGNPTSDKGRGAKVDAQVLSLLQAAGRVHDFTVMDITGTSFDDSLNQARERAHEYDYLVVVGGDGMIALGANAVGCSGKPLGVVAMGSGNDFARGLKLPVNRIETAVEGIVGAIVCGSTIDVDMGRVTSLEGGHAVDPTTGAEYESADGQVETRPIDRYYAGMLSCGIDASINDRANHSRLPNGSVRYFAAVLVELTRMKRYGYHVKATLADGSTDERDIVSPLLTVANSRHIGGGIEVSPYSCFSDGLLDLVWMDHVPNFGECAVAVSNAYNGRLLASRVFGWERVREIEITRADEGDEPPLLMADGEYIGRLPVRVVAEDCALRVLVPPAVAAQGVDDRQRVMDAIARDGRDPLTGRFE